MSFLIRQLEDPETIGAKLKQMRRRLAIPIEEAAHRTRIQKRYLKALEADAFCNLPEPIYTRNFLRTYVKMLGGDVNYFLKRYDEECGTCDVLVDPLRLPRKKVAWFKFLVAHRILKTLIIAVLGLGITGYIGWQIQSVLKPPVITVYEPMDGIATDKARVNVTGKTNEQVELFVNGSQVLPDASGYFSTVVDLERGLNIITIEGSKRYSRKAIFYRTVVFEEDVVKYES